ncbi:SpoIIE family protein phosphatase [Streptomyces sp. NPDC101158]|uniref:SpoIIE family protein phosphatase n=1 Tax=Streptomyces sp. NPDC101158 TaxID=3366117 RepID=UPI00381750AD
MTDDERSTRGGEIGPTERLAMNRTGSFDWDLDTGTIDVDDAGLLVFGLAPGDFDGRPATLVRGLDPGERTRLEGVIRQAITSGESSYTAHVRLERIDGTPQWTHVQARILRRAGGMAHRIVGIVRDATTEVTHSAFVLDLEKRREVQTSIVERTTHALSRAVTVDDVTAALTGPGGLARLGAEGLALGLVENGSLNVIALSGESMEAFDDFRSRRLERGLPLAEAVLSGRPRFVNSFPTLGQDFPQLAEYVRRMPFRSACYLPLVAQARALGGMALFYRRPSTFKSDERNLLLGLAAIVAQSLQRAILFDEERELATGLQATMLPRRIPVITGGEIAVRYHAAWSGRQVGGDWYDVIPLPRGRVGVVVGDVQGHDTHAAAIMGQLRIALRAYAGEGHAPSTVLARASRFLAELDTNRFATCTYAQVDLAGGTVRGVRAGHLGPLIRHTDGRVGRPKLRGGLPLGLATVFGEEEFPETRLDLVPGETLVLCTDGLVEQPGTDIETGLAALADAVSSGPPQAEALADHLSETLWERWGSGDDVALLVLRRSPDPGTPRAPRIHQYIHQADPQGLSDARAAVGQALVDWGMPELADDAELLTGELLVNVLLHTEGGAVLTLEVLPEPVRRVRLSVQDRSSAWPRRRTPGEAATSGRGLLLMDAIASRWGVEPRGEGKAVWCEIGADGSNGSVNGTGGASSSDGGAAPDTASRRAPAAPGTPSRGGAASSGGSAAPGGLGDPGDFGDLGGFGDPGDPAG